MERKNGCAGMGTNGVEALESRRMLAVNVGVSFTALNTEVPRYIIPAAKTTFKTQFAIYNSGDALPKTAKPADVKLVLRPTTSGSDVVLGTVKGSVVKGIKAGKSKLFNQTINIKPNTVPEGDYRLTLTFDGTPIGDTQTQDNTSLILNLQTTVTANPPGPMDAYGLGNKVTFTKTGVSDGHGIFGTVHEVGTFTDSRGKTGTYDVVIQSPRIPLPGTLDFDTTGLTGNGEFFFTTKKLKTLNKVTLEFTAVQAGSIGFMQTGTDGVIYFKIAKK
jgi:hypothetical protein